MVVGIMQFELLVHGAESLKDKRSVVRQVKDRLHRDYLVSVAEVAMHDRMTAAVMGVAVVASDAKRACEVLDAITAKLRKLTDAELGDCVRQVVRGEKDSDGKDEAESEADRIDTDAIAKELLARADSLEITGANE